MKIFRDLDSIGPIESPHVGIGNFDGVHLGHQRILSAVIERARAGGGTAVAMTFDPHPLSILRPTGRPPLITPLGEKIRILEHLGLEVLLVVPFTRDFAAITAEEFICEILAGKLGARRVCVGTNFHFGRGGLGDFSLLAREGRAAGIEVEKVEAVLFDDRPISSTRIRENILRGRMERVAQMLGRPYVLTGHGVEGKKRGHGLGYSTANLTTGNEMIPKDGVYVTWAEVRGARSPGVTNIGVRPTFGEHERVIETHLLSYEGGSLYGEAVRLAFCTRIRDERRFDSPEVLVEQIGRDVAVARRWFEEHRLE